MITRSFLLKELQDIEVTSQNNFPQSGSCCKIVLTWGKSQMLITFLPLAEKFMLCILLGGKKHWH